MNETVYDHHKSGYVAIIGKPNVGKSTLMNALVGRKLSIVTHKPQTTRHRILGIYSSDETQIIFLDTPGIIQPRYRLQSSMMRNVQHAIGDADLLLFMADATIGRTDTFSIDFAGKKPAILVINKMDLIEQKQALPLVDAYVGLRSFEEVIPISAKKGSNLDILLVAILERLPPGPPLYPKDKVSEHPERFFIAEIIREKVFEQYREEVPYATQVNIVSYTERESAKDHIAADIVVERDTQKGIIIGKKGQTLKRVAMSARKDIEAFIGKPVYLELHVKVRTDWRNKEALLRSYGFRT